MTMLSWIFTELRLLARFVGSLAWTALLAVLLVAGIIVGVDYSMFGGVAILVITMYLMERTGVL
jgi:hypothetical protein